MRMRTIAAVVCLCSGPILQGQPVEVEPVSVSATEPWPIVIAHRGASGYLPEHTTEAAAYAHALRADYIEQDCVLSKDGVPLVLHDVTLDHVTNVDEVYPERRREDRHWYAWDFTLQELQQLTVRERFRTQGSPRFPGDQGRFQIATLQDHIDLIRGLDHSRGTSTGLYIELKQPARHREEGQDLSAAVLDVLKSSGLDSEKDRVFLQCFEPDELRRLRTEFETRWPLIQLLQDPPTAGQIREFARVVDGLGVSVDCVVSDVSEGDDPEPVLTEVVRLAHENAMQVHVWTVRTDRLPKQVPSLDVLLHWLVQKAGADGIFTDQPDAVLSWRNEAAPENRAGPFQLIRQR